MSEFSCPVVRIDNLKPVPNSDALEMTTVFETPVIVRKGQLKVGDLAVYIPVESMVPMTKPQFQGLGIKTEREIYRVKAVRLRGTYSEGLLVPYASFKAAAFEDQALLGKDMAPEWGITKYEEPEVVPSIHGSQGTRQAKEVKWGPRYGVENLLRRRADIQEGEEVEVTEKIHGCNARFTFGPDEDGIHRLHVGSHNVWKAPIYKTRFLTFKKLVNWATGRDVFDLTPVNDDVWYTIAKRYKLAEKLKAYSKKWPKVVIYGEIYGKVQDLKYGKDNDVDFVVFAAFQEEWMSPDIVQLVAMELGLPYVPVLYTGPYKPELVDQLRFGKSILDGKTLREGIVIKPLYNEGLNTALKYVSEDYKLRKNGTEHH